MFAEEITMREGLVLLSQNPDVARTAKVARLLFGVDKRTFLRSVFKNAEAGWRKHRKEDLLGYGVRQMFTWHIAPEGGNYWRCVSNCVNPEAYRQDINRGWDTI